jgi:hypothetical protein
MGDEKARSLGVTRKARGYRPQAEGRIRQREETELERKEWVKRQATLLWRE